MLDAVVYRAGLDSVFTYDIISADGICIRVARRSRRLLADSTGRVIPTIFDPRAPVLGTLVKTPIRRQLCAFTTGVQFALAAETI